MATFYSGSDGGGGFFSKQIEEVPRGTSSQEMTCDPAAQYFAGSAFQAVQVGVHCG